MRCTDTCHLITLNGHTPDDTFTVKVVQDKVLSRAIIPNGDRIRLPIISHGKSWLTDPIR